MWTRTPIRPTRSTAFIAPLLIAAALVCSPLLLAARADAPPKRVSQARAAAAAGKFELTVDSIMRGPRLVGYPPTDLRWSPDSRDLYFEWRRPGEDEASTYVVSRDGGDPRKLSDEERKLVPPGNAVWDHAHTRALFVDDGDIVVIDGAAKTRHQVTRTTGGESNPRWARNDTAVTFVRDNNLFIVPLAGGVPGQLVQLTDVQPRKRDPRETDSQKYLKAEEQKLIDFTREAAEKKKKAEDKKKASALPVFELQDRQSATDLQLSADGDHVFMSILERAEGAKNDDVPNYVTESAYTEMISARNAVGDVQNKRLLGVMNLKTGKSVKPAAAFASGDVVWSMPQLSRDGKFAVATARSTDNKDRWLVSVDPESGATRVVDALHDDAWVREGGMGWMPDDKSVWFLSERDGWMHLYSVDVSASSAAPKQLTSGKWEITAAEISPDRKKFYITSTEVHPGERHVYSMALDGGPRAKITSMTGSNVAEVSPDESTLGLVHSYSNRPPEVYLAPNRAGAPARQITTTPTDEWRSFKWADPQVVSFKARDGVDVPARLFTPDMLGARRDPAAPGVVFVHGAGYAQNAHKYWASYYREYMFHNLLASRGYVVLDVDYRASSGYGRDWRTAIYRHMGGKDLDDIVDGAKYLSASQKVNPKRIGVYGGSYGGFITLMALFTSPDTFAAGAALRPVTDWAHYNHGYTSNILNEPQKDAEAYRRSSPIYFAGGLKGALLICHGVVDTNVFFQDSVRLVQRLIELRKENWELAIFPVENHGFERETSWADEYKRILKLFEENLRLKSAARATN
jgi:dipeptidyl aminopeptidase/acylaminoacyl peptidase